MKLPNLTKSKEENFMNWMERRKMCAGLPHQPCTNPWPESSSDDLRWVYPHFSVLKVEPVLNINNDEFVAI